MSKQLLIGDPHLKISKFDISISFLKWLDKIIETESPDTIVYLGDLFEYHAVLRSEILSEFKKHLLRNSDINKVYVLGNHDGWRPTDFKYHALESLNDIDNLTVIDRATTIDNITYVPYMYNLNDFPTNTADICIAHQTFVGADYGYYRPEVGVDADKIDAQLIISGHVHKRQTFGKVIYPGSPFAQGVNDIDQDKGVMILDTDTFKYHFISSPFPQWKGIKYEISSECSTQSIIDSIIADTNETDNWVIDITGPKIEVVSIITSNAFTTLNKRRAIRTRTNYTDTTKKRVQIKATTMGSIVQEYIDKVYDGSVDKSKITDKALDILKKFKDN